MTLSQSDRQTRSKNAHSILTLSVRGPTLDGRIHRRQILMSQVDPRK